MIFISSFVQGENVGHFKNFCQGQSAPSNVSIRQFEQKKIIENTLYLQLIFH